MTNSKKNGKTRHLTQPEAWRYIAERYLASGRAGPVASEGLCNAVGHLYEKGLISNGWGESGYAEEPDVKGAMLGRIEDHLGGSMWAYSEPFNCSRNDDSREARNARGMAALWLALESEEDST